LKIVRGRIQRAHPRHDRQAHSPGHRVDPGGRGRGGL